MMKKRFLLTLIMAILLILIIPMETTTATLSFQIIDQIDDSDSTYATYCGGTFLYTCAGTDGLIVYNTTNLYAIQYSIDDGGEYRDVSSDGGYYVFVACGTNGLRAYYCDETSLTLLDTIKEGWADYYYNVYWDYWNSGYIYTGCGNDGIIAYSFDFGITNTFTLLGQQYDGGEYYGITSDGPYYYVACGTDGLRAYTFDGANFWFVDSGVAHTVYDVWVDNSAIYIYTACGNNGIYVYTMIPGLNNEYSIDNGGNYTWLSGNDTQLYVSCSYDGIRAYTLYNGIDMTLLTTRNDGSAPDYYTSVFNEGWTYTIATKLIAGVYILDLVDVVAPNVTANPATNIGMTTATLNATLNTGGSSTVYFEWGTTLAYGHSTPYQTKTTGENFNSILTGLQFNTTYHFRAVATNGIGTNYSSDESFTTLPSTGIVPVDWTGIFDGIGRMFTGGNYTDSNGVTHSVTGIFGGGQDTRALLGVFIFAILFLLTTIWGLGILIGSVAIIPSVFAVMNYIPELGIIVAIVAGLLFGLGLNRIVRR